MFRRFFSNSTLKTNLTFGFNKIANYSNYFELYNIDVLFFINKSELETKYNNLVITSGYSDYDNADIHDTLFDYEMDDNINYYEAKN
jgi:hypothetical protein